MLRRKEKAKEPKLKKRRLELRTNRIQLRNIRERVEGQTYHRNMELLSSRSDVINCSSFCFSEDVFDLSTDDLVIVFFDIETGGLKLSDDILQICMKYANTQFNSFITPTKAINNSASKINKLTKVNKKLFHHGIEVKTQPCGTVFTKLLEYLQSLKKKCILFAHNCNFDAKRIVLAIKNLGLLQEYKEVIFGFSDSLELFRVKYPERTNGHKLTTLAEDLLDISCDNAHDARFDVNLLEKLTSFADLNVNNIIQKKKSVEEVLIDLQNIETEKKNLPTFDRMKNFLSKDMRKRLSKFDISYQKIV